MNPQRATDKMEQMDDCRDVRSPAAEGSPSMLNYSPRYSHSQEGRGSDSDTELAYVARYNSVYGKEAPGLAAGESSIGAAGVDRQSDTPDTVAGLTVAADATEQASSADAAAATAAGGNGSSGADSDGESISRVVEYTHSASLSARSAAAAAAALAARTAAMSERISSGLSGQSVEAALQLLDQEASSAATTAGGGAANTYSAEVAPASSLGAQLAAALPDDAPQDQPEAADAWQRPQPDGPELAEQVKPASAGEEHAPSAAAGSDAPLVMDERQEDYEAGWPDTSTAAAAAASNPYAPAGIAAGAHLPSHELDPATRGPTSNEPALDDGASGALVAAPIMGHGAGGACLNVDIVHGHASGDASFVAHASYTTEAAGGSGANRANGYGGGWSVTPSSVGVQQANPAVGATDQALQPGTGVAAVYAGAEAGDALWEEELAEQMGPSAEGVISTSTFDAEAALAEVGQSGPDYPAASEAAPEFVSADIGLRSAGGSTLLDEYRVAAAAGLVRPELASILGLAPPITGGELQQMGSGEVPAGEKEDGEDEEEEEPPAAALPHMDSHEEVGPPLLEATEQEALSVAEPGDVVLDLISGGVGGDGLSAAAAPVTAPGALAPAVPTISQPSAAPSVGVGALPAPAAAGQPRDRDPFYAGDTDEEESFVVEPLQDAAAPVAPAQQLEQGLAGQRAAAPGFVAAPSQLAAPQQVAGAGGQPEQPGPAASRGVGISVGAAAAGAAAGVGLMAGAAGAAAMVRNSHSGQADVRQVPQQVMPHQQQQAPGFVPQLGPVPPHPNVPAMAAQPHGPMQHSGPPQLQHPQQMPAALGPAPAAVDGPTFSPSGPPLPTSMRPSASPATPPGPRPALQPQPQLIRMPPGGSPHAGPGPAPGEQPIPPQQQQQPVLRLPGGPAPPGFPPVGMGPRPLMGPPPQGQQHPGQLPPGVWPPGALPPGMGPQGPGPRLVMGPQGPGAGIRPPGVPGMQAPVQGGPGAGPGRPQGQLMGPMPRVPGAPGGPPVPGGPMGAVRPPMMVGPRPPMPPNARPLPPPPPSPYPGLLYTEGRDALGRPVVVLNTAMLPTKAKKNDVLQFVLQQLQPVVQREYVLVVLSLAMGVKASSVSSTWALGAYRSLAKPYRKNVKHIILVQPSAWARALLALAQPFVSKKAAHKVKKVDNLVQVAEATNGEVRLESLGARFIREIQYGLGAPPLAGLDPGNGAPRTPQGPPPNGAPLQGAPMPMPGPGGPPRPGGVPPGHHHPARGGPLVQPLLSPQSPSGPQPPAGARAPPTGSASTAQFGPGGPGPGRAPVRPEGPPGPRAQLFPPGPGVPGGVGVGPGGGMGGPRPMGGPPAGQPGGFTPQQAVGRQGPPPRAPGQ